MGFWVQKYGGTSVGSPERLQKVADQIKACFQTGHSLVVVVSAMGNTTDDLIELAHQVSKNPPHREMDMLLSSGERISMALLSMALEERGVPAVSFTGSQTGILTDTCHRRARIQSILGGRVKQALEARQVAIVAGFQGMSTTKEITTLGRGGSDTTAVALAAALKADRCDIYTDVDGVFSADPRKVPAARHWGALPGDLLVELAVRGAGVLHPRSVELALQAQVPLWVRNSFFVEREGTQMMPQWTIRTHSGLEDFQIVGVTADPEQVLVQMTVALPSLDLFLQDLTQRHLTLSTVSLQKKAGSALPNFQNHEEGLLQFFAHQEAFEEWKVALEKAQHQGWVHAVNWHLDQVPLALVGYRFAQDSLFFPQVLATLAQHTIAWSMSQLSSLSMTLGVHRDQADQAVRILHRTFLERVSS